MKSGCHNVTLNLHSRLKHRQNVEIIELNIDSAIILEVHYHQKPFLILDKMRKGARVIYVFLRYIDPKVPSRMCTTIYFRTPPFPTLYSSCGEK